jgi:hypothetical protein
VNESFELGHDEHVQFWLESMRVAEAVNSVVAPINYEVHGNTLPHLTCTSSRVTLTIRSWADLSTQDERRSRARRKN